MTEKAEDSAERTATQASALCDRLRRDLLEGRLRPSRRLQLKYLMQQYDAGQTPIREALNRLASEGLVEIRDQRGFVVAGISADELRELTKTRCWLEERALRESMAAASPEWEEALVVAWHRLSKAPRSLSREVFDSNPEWERLHRIFHRQLIIGCGSRWLVNYCEQQADLLYRYRQLSIRRVYPTRNVKDEHEAILKAVVDGDAEGAVALLTAHYQGTANVILSDPDVFGPGVIQKTDMAKDL
ncbi:GntR family transcriptional regulator [Alsobacter metallidurans]|uniref:GntR family transcriptional regulator n=1 Tax=Alsobacter metallidurans TaxID=340221 RepID=A0A917I2W3_9HYPH|nr:GntR family transcriptional regulator [Alsobacter metallidurans]GGH07041.1 GntR family transcriptional regulator [Alsobacter metallidurans]